VGDNPPRINGLIRYFEGRGEQSSANAGIGINWKRLNNAHLNGWRGMGVNLDGSSGRWRERINPEYEDFKVKLARAKGGNQLK